MRARALSDASDYEAPAEVTVPSGGKARFAANLAAVKVLLELDSDARAATPAEQEILARWSGWGAIPEAFSGASGWEAEARELRETLTPVEYAAARATTLNAHFTDPAIVTAMWDAVAVAGGTVAATILEPGSGSGNFLGRAPEGVRMIGVEVDPTSARLSHELYPSVQVRNQGFERTIVRDGMVDGVIGNVPFGSFTLHDPMHNPARLSIHNHFIVKSLVATRPGGLVAVVTSGHTMDAGHWRARSEMARLGDLVAGVRLPTDAFSRVAGTEVNTDVLVFQRRHEIRAVPDMETLSWAKTVAHPDSDEVLVNQFFADHPERVAGTLGTRLGRFGPMLDVQGPTGAELGAEVSRMLTQQLEAGSVRVTERTTGLALSEGDVMPGLFEQLPADLQPQVGSLLTAGQVPGYEGSAEFMSWDGTAYVEVHVPVVRRNETRDLVSVRRAVDQVLFSQSDSESSPSERDAARVVLNRAYDHYVGTYGPVNRFTLSVREPTAARMEKWIDSAEKAWRQGLPDWMDSDERAVEMPSEELRSEWQEEAIAELTIIQKQQPHLRALRADPMLGSVLGLEVFDEDTQEARKSLIFERDVVTGAGHREAETIDEAIAISMDEAQRIEIERVAELLGVDVDEARRELVGAAFEDPRTGQFQPRGLYLSGAVRDKLREAEAAAERDERFGVNVEALRDVQPEWIPIEQIDLVPGVNVLDAEDYRRFIRDALGVDAQLTKVGDTWKINHPPVTAFSSETIFRFGTRDRKPTVLLEAVMNQKPVQIRYRNNEDKVVLDRPQTAAAREKCEQLGTAFGQWVREDGDLSSRVERQWNETFNQQVAADFAALGKGLELPGLSAAFTPHAHQREGVARLLNSPATLLNHVVGAGKTGTMVMGAMELRRTGRSTKPWVVVPNHLVEQVTREASQWYPSARVLSIPTGLKGPQERQVWMARSAGQDWDLVVVPQSTFKLMGVSPALAHEWAQRKLDELREARAELGSDDANKYSIKALEAQMKTLKANCDRLLQAKDPGMTFEQTGCDHLIIDEAHLYKNLARQSDVTDLNHAGSQIASDLDMKIAVLREHRTEVAKRDGTWREGMIPHVVDFSTGTPVANNMAELWVMQRYLRPDILEAQGIDSLRDWARAFARTGQALEMSGDGSTWKVKDRVRSFANLPELMATNRVVMSTVTREDISAVMPEAIPAITGGARQIHTRAASDQVVAYGVELKKRAEHPDPTQKDNILRIIKDGQLVALDPRMRGMDADADGGRIAQVADEVAAIHERTREDVYVGRDGQEEPRAGSLQLVFLDDGVPGGVQINLYEILSQELQQRGLEAEKIAFIHDAGDDQERASLFERCRDGRVNVLVGSTKRMGTGVNVQRRAVALHHVDVPWRPDELEQREGRLIRQGNANREVEIHTYITTGTVDAMSWGTIERKAAFINQVVKGNHDSRTLEQDDEDMEQVARHLAALAADSPLVMERVDVMNSIARLENLQSAHRTELGAVSGRLRTLRQDLAVSEEALPRITQVRDASDLEVGIDTGAHPLPTTMSEASDAIRAVLETHQAALAAGETVEVGSARGVPVVARQLGPFWRIHVQDVPEVGFEVEATPTTIAKTNFAVRLTNQIDGLEARIQKEEARIAGVSSQAEELQAVVDGDGGFSGAEELRAAQLRLTEIDSELGMSDDDGELSVQVFASEMRGRLELPGKGHQLREGDSFKAKGKKELFTLSRIEGESQLYGIPDGGDQEVYVGRIFSDVELISRPRAVMTPWETECLDRGERDAMVTLRSLEDGTAVLIPHTVDGRQIPIQAVVDKIRGNDLMPVRITEPGVNLEDVEMSLRGLVKDYFTEEQVANRKAAETMLSGSALYAGETIAAAFDETMSAREDVVGAVVTGDGRATLADGKTFPLRGWRARASEPERVAGDELAAVCGAAETDLADLRPGDRVLVRAIDRDARSDQRVTVLESGSPYERSAQTTYRTDEGNRALGKTKRGTSAQVESRTISALTLPERVQLAELRGAPIEGVTVIPRDELEDHIGERVGVARGPLIEAGTLGTREGHRGQKHLTVDMDDGRVSMVDRGAMVGVGTLSQDEVRAAFGAQPAVASTADAPGHRRMATRQEPTAPPTGPQAPGPGRPGLR